MIKKVFVCAILAIWVLNSSIIFLHADSEPFRDVPADQLRIESWAAFAGGDPRVSVNIFWVRGWYQDSVAVMTVCLVPLLLWCFDQQERKELELAGDGSERDSRGDRRGG